MKRTVITIAIAAATLTAGAAFAQESPWMVRARAVHIDPADRSSPIGGVTEADLITVSKKTIPEVDISYFFTPNWAAELVLTYPQKHTVKVDGTSIGSFKHLPPTLTLQYHFLPNATFNPYLGAGINYTRISSVRLDNDINLEKNSWGLALQAGFDVKLNRNWSINVDVKKVQIRSDVSMAGEQISRVKLDPVLFGVGVGYRF
ncbi:MAG TPA: OmpW family outer membrane protein [Noviherbaspirillum sp.]